MRFKLRILKLTDRKNKSGIIIIVFLILLMGYPAYPEWGLQEKVIKWLSIREINPYIIPSILSMLPIFELRGGIPVGLFLLKLNPYYTFLICVISNMIPVIPLLFFLNGIMRFLSKRTGFKKIIQKLEIRARRNEKLVERYKEIALLLFVAIPLPITGAWTGSLLSTVFNLNIYKSMFFIGLGVITAGLLVMGISLIGRYFMIGAISVICIIVVIYIISVFIKLKKSIKTGNTR